MTLVSEEERLDSPDRDLSQGYMSDENLSERSDNSGVDPNVIYTNKYLNLEKIKSFGFDMDYTLCEYLSPAYDILGFDLAKQHLVGKLGYDKDILEFKYNPKFPVRGLWLDKSYGNLLKVDQFGKILVCIHGFRKLSGSEVRALYPHKMLKKDNQRIFVMNTLFNIPETYLYSCLVDFFNRKKGMIRLQHGWKDTLNGNKEISFRTLFQDLRDGIDYIHVETMEIKKLTVANMPRYVKKDGRLPSMLKQMRNEGRTTFLLTNSDWWYTNLIMDYLLGDQCQPNETWLSWFDLTIVDGCKPRFFTGGTPLRTVDTSTGNMATLENGDINNLPLDHRVYSGGDHQTVTRILGVEASEILYCGDHLYGDVIKCRKECEWRTLLVVPELVQEMTIFNEEDSVRVLEELNKLENLVGQGFAKLDEIRHELMESVLRLDNSFGQSGSLFRAGNRLTYFGSQMMIWADIYTGSVYNLWEYGVNQRFYPLPQLLPHEIRLRDRGSSPDV